MIPQHRKALAIAAVALAVGWGVAIGGRTLAAWTNRTAEKLVVYGQSLDMAQMSGSARIAAIDKFARDLRSLPLLERQRSRFEHPWSGWFDALNSNEKEHFAEVMAPVDLDRVMTSFEQAPEERRQLLVGNSVRRLRDLRGQFNLGGYASASATESWEMPDLLQKRLIKEGLKTHYTELASQGRVDFSLFLEEIQQMMGNREALRNRPYRGQGANGPDQ